MNFEGFSFDAKTETLLSKLDSGERLPHAIVVESQNKEYASQLATLLSMYAVCTGETKPCGICKGCVNAKNKTHADVSYPPVTNKSKTYSIEQMRDIIADAYILPNEARAKVYVFEDADSRLTTITQNAFLKLLEEPPQNVYFILLCENAQSLLITILSRCTVIRLGGEQQLSDEAVNAAVEITEGILSTREYGLMKSLECLKEKEQAIDILSAVKRCLRDALVILSGGEAIGDKEIAQNLAARLTRAKLMDMIELCDSSEIKIKQNSNINLLTTWLCGEFRRITWQR